MKRDNHNHVVGKAKKCANVGLRYVDVAGVKSCIQPKRENERRRRQRQGIIWKGVSTARGFLHVRGDCATQSVLLYAPKKSSHRNGRGQ